jgi:hypothetical protein
MRECPVHESSQFGLMPHPGLGKRLLKLAPRCRQSNPHHIGGSLQAVTIRDGYRGLCFPIREVESSP